MSFICVGWLAHRQQGHLETALPFSVPCEGREALFLHCSHRESNPGRCVAVHYTTAAPPQLHLSFVRWYIYFHSPH